MTAAELQTLLELYVPRDRACGMAQAISEDMNSVRWIVEEAHYTSAESWRRVGATPQAEYVLPPNQFDINCETGSKALEGSFVTTGNLLRLAQCVMLARRYIPELWPDTFAARIRGEEHLDALNEIWWLKFFRGIQAISRGPKKSGNDPDFEWEIALRDGLATCSINLEVKRRTSNINKLFKQQRPNASVRKISKKFGPVDENTANVAALTVYYPVSSEIDRDLRIWLESQEHLHGLLVWTEGHFGTPPLKKFIKESRRWVEFLIQKPEAEDLRIAGHTKGTLCETKDAPRFLGDLARQMWNA